MVYHHDIAEIMLKVALNTIPGIVWTGSLYMQTIFNVCVEFKMLFITNILIDKDWTNIIQLLFGGLYLCDAFFFSNCQSSNQNDNTWMYIVSSVMIVENTKHEIYISLHSIQLTKFYIHKK
jgi:hypothetical protein